MPGPANRNAQRIGEMPFSVVHGPPGSYAAEWLAGLLEGWDRWQRCVWLRASTPRSDALAGPLASACLHRWIGAGELDEGRLEVTASLGLDKVLRRSPSGAVIVLELAGRFTPDIERLVESVRAVVADRGVSLVAVTESRFPMAFRRGPAHVVAAADLAGSSADVGADGLPGRLVELSGRRAAVVHDVLDAAATWPREAVVDAVDTSRGFRSMLRGLTANLVDLCTPGQLAALEVCVATGYWHPQLATEPVSASGLRPWVVPLEQGWGWLRPIWARSLKRHLEHRADREHRSRRGIPSMIKEPRAAIPAQTATSPPAVLEARLLGPFELRFDGLGVTMRCGQRGLSVMRYLLSRRRHACPRDELLAEFWPDVAPSVARNRLQVAVSGVRRALLEVTNMHVIEYADGGYQINPDLRVETDVGRFEAALAAARSAERAGDPRGALAAYREAIGHYRGDFASDSPYEQWTVLPRESLRLGFIDALDRLSRIQFGSGRLDDCIATGHRMLDVDPCREDAHRLLMRCYASQGRAYQAIRQYEFCRRVLTAMLQSEPDIETTRLYRAVRAGSPALALAG
ncbi:MAG TPA: BTAD domain-containing putative transcriptional regulator [Jiangellaceae bacterium]|nr:BTAD domain-containing putative transcriptional regulator [Jiangellaceae bacterium]